MIERYSRAVMSRIFTSESRLEIWLDVELAVADAMAELGYVPADGIADLRERVALNHTRLIDPARIEEIEAVTRHDVIAFLTHVEEVCGENARYLHRGMTSSDLLDTALSLQLTRAARVIDEDLEALLAAIERRAQEHRTTVCIGRSHGIHAEPTTFGLKLAGHYAEFARQRRRLAAACDDIAVCAISGAVGTFAQIDPQIEERVAARLELRTEPISTQVIPRDRHAHFVCVLAQIAGSIERLALEVRHLQRSEVREVEEFFHAGQKGSSAMPHKRNPVLSENLTGLARMIRAAAIPALENVALWHERDISHSSVERVMLPDACILTDFALARLSGLIERLTVYPERMRRNLEASFGLFESQRVMLALTEAGLSRQRAYEIVQSHAMCAWQEERPLLDLLEADDGITELLPVARLRELFDPAHHLVHVDAIFARVFGDRHD